MGERKYPNVSIEVLEKLYRRYMKGEVMESKLAYQTARGKILDELEMVLVEFIMKLKTRD